MNPTSSHHRAFLTTDYLTQLILLLKGQGFSIDRILNQSQLREEDFHNNSRISPMQYQKIVENAISLSQDPLLGIRHGQRLNISSHGFVGFAAMAADNLGQALSLAIRYARTRTLLADIRFHKENDSAVIQINRLASMPDTFSFVVENIISSFIAVARFLLGQQEELSAVIKLTYPPQGNPSEYEQLFGVPVLFNQPYNQICLPEFLLESPVSTANAISRGLAETECEKLLAQLNHGQDLVTQIRYRLEKMQAFPTLPVMAKTLNSSPRTINRQLAQLNTSYQHTIDEARREKAIALLDQSSISIEQISISLGYNDPSNFGRAFRRWLGQSPRAYRKSKL
jgi:AraC-like DNA-binding protein